MSYLNPQKWISPDDELIPDIEEKLIADKRAYSVNVGIGKSFKPPSGIEFSVTIKETSETLRLVEWEDRQGKIFLEITAVDNTFRKGHFNQGWHHNPNRMEIKPPHHIHFPTKNYPLTMRPTYAYPVKSDKDYLSALSRFCNDTNIELSYATIPLMRR